MDSKEWGVIQMKKKSPNYCAVCRQTTARCAHTLSARNLSCHGWAPKRKKKRIDWARVWKTFWRWRRVNPAREYGSYDYGRMQKQQNKIAGLVEAELARVGS